MQKSLLFLIFLATTILFIMAMHIMIDEDYAPYQPIVQEIIEHEFFEPEPPDMAGLVSFAPHYTLTRPSVPHPERIMTAEERDAWILDYYALGGKNAQEIELFEIINLIRYEHELPPFILCPRLSHAARLFSYLQVRYHSVGHVDPYYGDLMARSNFFGAYGSLYMENANSQQWTVSADGTITYVYLSPQQLVDGWMSSDPHREHILTTKTTHAGFGVDSGLNRVVPTMKTLMPR